MPETKNKSWVIELEPGVWLTAGHGDPARTLVQDSAKRFNTQARALMALGDARKHRPFVKAKAVEVHDA